jgi:glycosyltransferase involved in cell wall biosynthesis
VVVVNRAYKELFPSTTLIKNGIPKEVFNYCSYKQLEKPLKIFFPNIDSPKKNRAFAIDLIEKLDEKHKGIFKLILVGEKENLNIDNKLYEFVGLKKWGQEMSALYRNSFITIIPSISESCSLCTLESMSSGTVVIANDIPGIRDYVLNNKTGFLISVNDFRKWVKKIETLLRDQILYDRIQKSAKDSIHENFNVERMAEEYYLMWLKLFKMKYAKK